MNLFQIKINCSLPHVQCFDSLGGIAALRVLLLDSIFQIMNMYHICCLKTFAFHNPISELYTYLLPKGPLKLVKA